MEHNLDLINEPQFNEILVITNTTHKRKRKIYLHAANNSEHVIKDEGKGLDLGADSPRVKVCWVPSFRDTGKEKIDKLSLIE